MSSQPPEQTTKSGSDDAFLPDGQAPNPLRQLLESLYDKVQGYLRSDSSDNGGKERAPDGVPERRVPDHPGADDLYPGAHQREGYVSFTLYAPGKDNVALAGNFNGWSQTAHPMRHVGHGLWWVALALPPGYWLYQFVVDGWLWIGDPYAREVEWDGDGPKAVLNNERWPYFWNDGGYRTRPLEEAILYEVHVGDFSPEGTFEGVRRRLDYIQSLGVTAIQLMPIMEFPTDHSWGYNPAFFFAPERAYGQPDDLRRLVDEAHLRGIAVVLDMVFNHTQQDNPLHRMWPYEQNPYFAGGNPWGMPNFNHYSDLTRAFIRDVQSYWFREFHIDGFRYDATAYIASDQDNGIGFFTRAAREAKGDAWLISEHLPQDPWWVHHTAMDAQWHDTFHDVMKAQLREGMFEGEHNRWGDLDAVERALNYSLDGFSHPRQVINYICSHDEQRAVREALSNPRLSYQIAHRKSALGMAAAVTAAGVPMLYAGEEMAMDSERSTDPVKLEWWRLEHDGGAQWLCERWRRLTWLRNTHPALRSPTFQTLAKWRDQKAIAFQRWNHEGDVVVVALNLSDDMHHVSLRFPHAGRWHEYLYDYALDTDGEGVATIELPPSGAKIYCLWRNW